jgi:hypothetical protein
MISLESKTTFESKTLPGVRFTIKKYTEGVRQELRRLQGSAPRELNEAQDEMNRALDEWKQSVAHLSAEEQARERGPLELWAAVDRVEDIRRNQIDPAYVRVALISVEGAQIDGHAMTAEDVINVAPTEFYREVLTRIKEEYGLTEREKGESEPPSTCGVAEGGCSNPTSAENASGTDSTSVETAPGTSLVM